MLGIIIADKTETNNLVQLLPNCHVFEFNNFKYYVSKFDNKIVVVAFSGIGKVNAAMCAMSLINNFNADKIINIGIAGTTKNEISHATPIIVKKCQYFDVDVTAFGYAKNQVPNEPAHFLIKDKYIEEIKSIINEKNIIGSLATGDSFIDQNNVSFFKLEDINDIVAIDMEACAIAQVSNKNKIDFICIKFISDNTSCDETNKKQYDENKKKIKTKIDDTVLKLIKKYI